MKPKKKIALMIVLIIIAVMMSLPFFWMLITSIKPDTELFSWPPSFIPKNLQHVKKRLNLSSVQLSILVKRALSITEYWEKD